MDEELLAEYYESEQELYDAASGAFGEEEQEEALGVAERAGYLQKWQDETAVEEIEESVDDGLSGELERFEEYMGREIGPPSGEDGRVDRFRMTNREREELIERLPVGVLDGVEAMPDLVAKYGREFVERRKSPEGRRAHMVATAETLAREPEVYEPEPEADSTEEIERLRAARGPYNDGTVSEQIDLNGDDDDDWGDEE